MPLSAQHRALAFRLVTCLLLCSRAGLAKPPSWDGQATLIPADGIAFERFGSAVAIDGNSVLVGAPGDDDSLHVADSAGSVYAWLRNGSQWQSQAKFGSPNPAPGQKFGSALSVRGGLAVVAAIGDNEHGNLSGAAYVFTNDGPTWTPVPQKLTGDEVSTDFGELFGTSVAVGTDLILIGAPGNDEMGQDAGAAYLFKRQGSSWSLLCKLFAPDPQPAAQFGYSVALSDTVAVVGAPDADSSPLVPESGVVAAPDTGAVYVFSGDFSGPASKLVSSDHATGDLFGIALSVSESVLAVGASSANAEAETSTQLQAGAVYVFNENDSDWSEGQKLFEPTPKAGDFFGSALAVDKDLLFVLAGDDETVGSSAFAFTLADQLWSAASQVPHPAELDSALYAQTVGISGRTAVIGTFGEKAEILALTSGSPCANASDCSLGNCTEGVCCATACDKGCSSCLKALKVSGTEDGTCEPVAEATDPNEDCVEQLASSCGTTGLCDGKGACSRYPAGTECEAAQCSASNTAQTASCDGRGQCASNPEKDCGSYACDAGFCRTDCHSSSDCAPNFFCNAGSECVPLQPPRCNADETAAIGTDGTTLTQCGDYRCRKGTCLLGCESSDDCSTDFGCNTTNGVCARNCKSAADCMTGQACDSTSHVCTTFCSVADDCADGSNCGPTSHQCTKKADCGKSSDCSEGFTCDTATSLCAKTCTTASDCPVANLACDPDRHLCTLACSTATDCAAALNCGPTHRCTSDTTCVRSSDCAAPLACDTASKQCSRSCSTGDDCENDDACDPLGHVCTRLCSSASNCRAGLNCGPTSHLCSLETACTSSNDCATAACSPSTGQCASDEQSSPSPAGGSCSLSGVPASRGREAMPFLTLLALIGLRKRNRLSHHALGSSESKTKV